MVLTYRECIERFGTDYRIKKELASGNLFQKEKGLYSDKKMCSELEIIAAKYSRAVFTGDSAYYYYGLTDDIPDMYSLATRRSDTRIREKNVRQYFVTDALFEIGKSTLVYQNIELNIYSRERLLVDLIRYKSKMPFDYYKEVIASYRRIVDELDFFAMEDYAGMLKNGDKIMGAIQLEVM
jgi:predicted transcriptional regulator of viral defense system